MAVFDDEMKLGVGGGVVVGRVGKVVVVVVRVVEVVKVVKVGRVGRVGRVAGHFWGIEILFYKEKTHFHKDFPSIHTFYYVFNKGFGKLGGFEPGGCFYRD